MAKVLLVEDEPDLASIVSRRLRRRGFDVIVAGDGNLAVTMAAEHLPDVIIMDLLLENGPDGTEATRRIKAQEQTAGIPVIIISASHLASFQQDAFDAGADDVDAKPVDFDRLVTKVSVLLEG